MQLLSRTKQRLSISASLTTLKLSGSPYLIDQGRHIATIALIVGCTLCATAAAMSLELMETRVRGLIMSRVRIHPIVFLGAELPNSSVFSRARLSFSLSLLVLSFAIVSLGTGVAAGRPLYAVVGNSSAALLPLLVAQSLRLKLWRADILATQCVMGTVYMLLIVIMDSIILAFTVTTYRFCYGEWSSRCESYAGSSGFDLVCTTSETAETSRFVTCSPRLTFTLTFVSLGCNLVHGVLTAPYLMACYALKLALRQEEADTWHEDDGYTSTVSWPVVILGEPGDPEEVDTVDSATVHSKLDNSFDSHEEYTVTRNLATSRCGLKSN